jgi:hypothetical protein
LALGVNPHAHWVHALQNMWCNVAQGRGATHAISSDIQVPPTDDANAALARFENAFLAFWLVFWLAV